MVKAKIEPMFVVDKQEYAEKSHEIFKKLKKKAKILLKRDLSN